MNKYFERNLLKSLKKWINRREIYAIKGPRQSGKTTLLFMLKEWLVKEKGVDPEKIIFITFEDKENLEKFTINPKEFIKSYISGKGRYYFLLDEFHYVKEGGKKLKLLYDILENVKFIITGSSSLELTGSTSKYLVGRMFSFNLYPLSFEEFLNLKNKRLVRIYREKNKIIRDFLNGENFEPKEDIFVNDFQGLFDEFVTFGGYPEVAKTEDKETKKIIIKNIYETYITKEIIELLKIHDIFKFRKLISILSSQLSGMTDYNELTSLCGSYYKEMVELLEILEETFVIRMIRPFHKNLRTELRKNPKVYFIDLGMRNYAINNFNSLEERVDKGSIVENFVLNQLIDGERINYWRTLGKAEVDFVLNFGDKPIPIEVKYTEFKKAKISRSFRSFLSAYEPSRAIVFTKNFWGKTKIGKTTVAFIPVWYA